MTGFGASFTRRLRRSSLTLAAMGLCATVAQAESVIAYAEIMQFSPLGAAQRTLTFASLSLTDAGNLIYTASFLPGTSMTDTMTALFIDRDGNPSTSYPVYFPGFDTAISTPGSSYSYNPYPMPPEPPVPPPPPSYSESSIRLVFPSSLVGLSVTSFNFAVMGLVQYSQTGSSGIQTYGFGQVTPVPEAPTGALLLAGLAFLALGQVIRNHRP